MSEIALFLTISKVRHRTHIHFISVQFKPSMIILKNKNFTKVVVGEMGRRERGRCPASHAFRMFSIPGRKGALLTSQNYKTPKHTFPIPDLNIEKRKKKRKGTVNMDNDRQKDTIDKR